MVINGTESTKETIKWLDKKLFSHTLDVSVWNSHCSHKFKQRKTFRSPTFTQLIIRQILQKYRKDNFLKIIIESSNQSSLSSSCQKQD